MSSTSGHAAMGHFSVSGSAKTRVVRDLAMSPEADDFLADLARRSGLSEGNVLRLALGMFRTAIDAKEQGKHIGVAQNSDDLDIEFVGF